MHKYRAQRDKGTPEKGSHTCETMAGGSTPLWGLATCRKSPEPLDFSLVPKRDEVLAAKSPSHKHS